jgi:ParB-like chromosome segregation protein Spo0J
VENETLRIDDIYVPTKRRGEIHPDTVAALAESILAEGQKLPITVRRDGDRLVLIEGLHRLEACKALGEATITGVIVGSRKF